MDITCCALWNSSKNRKKALLPRMELLMNNTGYSPLADKHYGFNTYLHSWINLTNPCYPKVCNWESLKRTGSREKAWQHASFVAYIITYLWIVVVMPWGDGLVLRLPLLIQAPYPIPHNDQTLPPCSLHKQRQLFNRSIIPRGKFEHSLDPIKRKCSNISEHAFYELSNYEF